MFPTIKIVVSEIKRTLEEIEIFAANDFTNVNSDLLFFDNLEELVTIEKKQKNEVSVLDPTPNLEKLAQRLIYIMPRTFCNALVKTDDKKHYFGVIENQNGLFAVFVPISKGQKIYIDGIKENILEL